MGLCGCWLEILLCPRHYKYFENYFSSAFFSQGTTAENRKCCVRLGMSPVCYGHSELEHRADEWTSPISHNQSRVAWGKSSWEQIWGFQDAGGREGGVCNKVFLSPRQIASFKRKKAFSMTGIFSKPHCHAEKHIFNKMPFLNSLQPPPLPFGREEGSVYNVDIFYLEKQINTFPSTETELSLRWIRDKLQRELLWKVEVIPKTAISC